MSWTKFFGTPPPIMKIPVVPWWTLTSVSSRKSLTLSIETCASGCWTWWATSPKPAEQSLNAGTKIGTSSSYATRRMLSAPRSRWAR